MYGAYSLTLTHAALCMGQHLSRQLAFCPPQRGFCSRLLGRRLLNAGHLHNIWHSSKE